LKDDFALRPFCSCLTPAYLFTTPNIKNYYYMTNTAIVLLAMFFFLAPLIYKRWKKEQIELADLGNCALAAMGLPNLFMCLFYLVVNPAEVVKMAELPQYLTIGVLIILFLTCVSISEVFKKPGSP